MSSHRLVWQNMAEFSLMNGETETLESNLAAQIGKIYKVKTWNSEMWILECRSCNPAISFSLQFRAVFIYSLASYEQDNHNYYQNEK